MTGQAAILALLLCLVGRIGAMPQAFTVAAIFDQDSDLKNDLMFVNALKSVNRIPGFLPPGVTLVPQLQKIPKENSFVAERVTCGLLAKGVLAVLGPSSKENSEHIKSICDASEIPFIETRRELSKPNLKHGAQKSRFTSISLQPDMDTLGDILVSLLSRYGWRRIAILYDSNMSLQGLQPVLELTAASHLEVLVLQLKREGPDEFRRVLKELVTLNSEHIVLACELDILWTVLNQAQQVGLVTEKQNWILTNLDAHTINFNPFKYDYTNFTLFRLIDFSKPNVQYSLQEIVNEEIRMGRSLDFVDFSGGLTLEAALIYDAVHLLGAALGQLAHVHHIQPRGVVCGDHVGSSWKHGSSIINYMRLLSIPGITGLLRFDSFGIRSEFDLDVLNLHEGPGILKVGEWSPGGGLTISGHPGENSNDQAPGHAMMNKSLTVTTIINAPYVMLKERNKLFLLASQF